MTRILCPVLVGRQAELAELDAAMHAARCGRGGVVFVSGPAGIGKSRLLGTAADTARGRGMSVLLGRSVPSKVPVPYRPIGEALLTAGPSAVQLDSRELAGFRTALGWIVPEWRVDGAPATVESPVVVAEALVRALQAIGGPGGSGLFLEDVQWADPETLHAVEYLADHLPRTHVVAVCTTRDEEPSDASELIARLDARRAAHLLRLGPLSPDEVVEVAARSLGTAAVGSELTALLQHSAEGVPFLVEELLAAAVTGGSLVRGEDGWQVSAPLGRLVPQSFATTVRARLDATGEVGRRFLGAAAILGRTFDWRVARSAAGCSPEAAHSALEQAIALQLLVAQDGAVSFRHALTREAIADLLLPTECAELAARCLAALDTGTAHGEDWRHLAADLAELAGAPDRAASLLLEAGRTSLRRGALSTAAAALDRATRVVREPEIAAQILEAQAEAHSAAGNLKGTEAAVAALLDTLASVAAPPPRRGQAHLLLARCAVTAARYDVATDALTEARRLSSGEGDAGLRARVDAVAAQLAVGEGRPDDAEALAARAAEQAEATSQPEVVCEALEVAARCARTRTLEEAEEIGRQAQRVADDAGLALWRMRALYQQGVVELFRSGQVGTLRTAREEAQRLGALATVTSLDVEISAGLEAQHRPAEAREVLTGCLAMARLLDLRVLEGVAHAFMAVLEAGAGARRSMEQAIARCLEVAGHDPEVVAALWSDARAVASLAEEDRPRARRELEAAVAIYTSPSSVVPRLAIGLLALVVAADGGEPDFSRAQGVTLLNCQVAGYLAYARAIQLGRARRPAEATVAARRGDEQLAHMPWYRSLVRRLAAEPALVDGWGEPVAWLAEAATYFAESGNDRLASACRTLLRRAGVRVARPTRALAALPAPLRHAGITPREAEVLALVGNGLGNREIASRLYLSERTVEQHVAALKQKLALRTRAQLAVYAAGESSVTS